MPMSNSEGESDDESLKPEPDINIIEQGQMLHSVLSDFLKYTDNAGGSLNLCETLLLLKNSIDENTKMQKQLITVILDCNSIKTTITKD